jgi:glutathione S-transferase
VADRESVRRWVRHWVGEGLGALESMVAGHPESGRLCHGETPTLADICLVPQISSAERFTCDLSAYPALMRIYEACMGLEAFEKTRPERQPDAE